VRILLAAIAYVYRGTPFLKNVSWGFFLIALVWIAMTAGDTLGIEALQRNSGPENEKIWWQKSRIFHAAFYLAFFFAAQNRSESSFIFLFGDVVFSLGIWVLNYFA